MQDARAPVCENPHYVDDRGQQHDSPGVTTMVPGTVP